MTALQHSIGVTRGIIAARYQSAKLRTRLWLCSFDIPEMYRPPLQDSLLL
jgi:hypothetical protein